MTARGRVALLLAAVLVAGGAGARPAAASFDASRRPSAPMEVTTATLQPATNVVAGRGLCLLAVGDAVVISWSASSSSWAGGYQVERSLGAGGPFVTVASLGPSTRSYTDSPVLFATTYAYRVRATKAAWTSSAPSTAMITTRSTLCL